MSVRRHSRRQASVDYPRYPPPSTPQFQQPTAQSTQLPHTNSTPAYTYPTHQISDYESDFTPPFPPPTMPSIPSIPSALFPPPIPPRPRTIDHLNLSVLQRHNPQITSILSIAPYAVIYTFTPSPTPSWIKAGVEGTLFMCALTPGPLGETRFSAFVINRRGLGNWEAELVEDEEAGRGVECTEQYVIVTGGRGIDGEAGSGGGEDGVQVAGIWVYGEGPGSSTAETPSLVARFIKERAVEAGRSRKEKLLEAAAVARAGVRGGGDAEVGGGQGGGDGLGVPMGRTISLQEMFGQQRRDDDEWSVKMHSPVGGEEEETIQSVVGRTASRQGQRQPQGQNGAPLAAEAGRRGLSAQQSHLMGLFANAGAR